MGTLGPGLEFGLGLGTEPSVSAQYSCIFTVRTVDFHRARIVSTLSAHILCTRELQRVHVRIFLVQAAYQLNGRLGPAPAGGARAALSPRRQPPQLKPHQQHAGRRMGQVPLLTSPNRGPLPSGHFMGASPIASVVATGGPANAAPLSAIPAATQAAPGFQAPLGSTVAASTQRELLLMRNK